MKKTVLMLACCMAVGTVAFAQNKKEVKAPPPPPPPPPKVEVVKFTPPVIKENNDFDDFYKRNPTVLKLDWKTENKVVITKKDKTTETYDINNAVEEKDLHEKYGDIPVKKVPPPPPPPPTKRQS